MKEPSKESLFDIKGQLDRLLNNQENPVVAEFVRGIPEKHLPPSDPESPQARILEAARTLFAEKGFDGASTREIADLASVNQAMIHYYYGNKRALYKQVIINQIYTLFLMITSMMPPGITPTHFIAEFPLRLIEHLRERPKFRRIMLGEIAGGGGTIREIIEELGPGGPHGLRKLMGSLIGEGVRSGALNDFPSDTVIYFLLSIGYSSIFVETFYSLVAGIDFSDERQWAGHRKTLKDILLHGLSRSEEEE